MLWMGIWVHPYTVILLKVGVKFRQTVMGSPNDIVVSRLRLKTPADCIPHTYWMYRKWKVFEYLHMLWMGIWMHPYTVILVEVGAKFRQTGLWGAQMQMTLWCHG
jgi:hypothetical protein